MNNSTKCLALLIGLISLIAISCKAPSIAFNQAYTSNGESIRILENGTYQYIGRKGDIIEGKWKESGDTLTLNSWAQPDSIQIKDVATVNNGKKGKQLCLQVFQNDDKTQAFGPIVKLNRTDGLAESMYWDLSDCFKLPRFNENIRSIAFMLPKGKGGGMATSRYIKIDMNASLVKVVLDYPTRGYPYAYHQNKLLKMDHKKGQFSSIELQD